MKFQILVLLIMLYGCNSEDKIRNTVEARIFLATHEWHDSRASFTTLDGETHTAGSTVKFTDEEVTSNNQTYTYRIESKPGGDSNSHTPYYEISWFDNYLNEEVKFYLNEDGGGYLISTRWKLKSYDNVGKPIAHVSAEEALQKEKKYQSMYEVYEAARTESAQPAADAAVPDENAEFEQQHTPLFQGTQVFCDTVNEWYYIVNVDNDYIILHLYSGIYNKDGDHSNPKESVAGKIKDGYRILTKSEDGNDQEIFTYSGEHLYVMGYEESVSDYKRCE